MILKELFGNDTTQRTTVALTAKERLEQRNAGREAAKKKQKDALRNNAFNRKKKDSEEDQDLDLEK